MDGTRLRRALLGAVLLVLGLALWRLGDVSAEPDPGSTSPEDLPRTAAADPPKTSVDRPPRTPGRSPPAHAEPAPSRQRSAEQANVEDALAHDDPTQADDTDAEAPPTVHIPDKEGIDDAVRERLRDIHACYLTHLHHTPDLAGKLVLEFTIPHVAADATPVSSVKVANSTLDATLLEGCIATVFEEMHFLPPEEEMVVSYPLLMEPG